MREPPRLASFPPKTREIIETEAFRAGLSVDRVLSDVRDKPTSRVRFRIWRIQREELTAANGEQLSWTQIARPWRRDHTTVIHGVRRAKELGI